MHPQLLDALGRLTAATHDLRDAASRLPASLHAQKPAADRWSVNEVLEHINIVETLFLTTLIKNVETAKASGLAGEVDEPAMLSAEVRASVEDRSTRRSAPERVIPTGTVAAADALRSIEAGHAQLRDALASAPSVTLSAVTFDHRVFGTLNVYQWIDFLAGHERRHLAQLREIAGQLLES
jgi:hypothetical protein